MGLTKHFEKDAAVIILASLGLLLFISLVYFLGSLGQDKEARIIEEMCNPMFIIDSKERLGGCPEGYFPVMGREEAESWVEQIFIIKGILKIAYVIIVVGIAGLFTGELLRLRRRWWK